MMLQILFLTDLELKTAEFRIERGLTSEFVWSEDFVEVT